MDLKSKIILIYGPTASGKSDFAIKLAKKIKGEIINADSMQIYKDLKILTARPLRKNCQKIKHHLYGFQNGNKFFSTGDWLKLATKKIQDIKRRKKIPILVGGTGLYFKALVKFYEKLLKIDPLLIDKIKSTDSQRSIRAYEVKIITKKSIIKWYEDTKPDFKKRDFFKLIINFPRLDLIQRINARTIEMFKNGATLEVKSFLKSKIPNERSISKAIGVSEIKEYLKNVIEKISIKTRQYAKRQMTWARGHMTSWKKIKPNQLNNFLKKV